MSTIYWWNNSAPGHRGYSYRKRHLRKPPVWWRICRSFWIPLGILLFLWLLISPFVHQQLILSKVEEDLQKTETPYLTSMVDSSDFYNVRENAFTEVQPRSEVSSTKKKYSSFPIVGNIREQGRGVEEQAETRKRHMFLFVAVASAPEGEKRRSTIRATWAQYFMNSKIPDVQLFESSLSISNFSWGNNSRESIKTKPVWELLFFVGRSKDQQIQERVEEEATVFGDIKMLPYEDGYYNLTLKTLAMFQWTSQHVDASYIFKADDDVYLHIPRLVEWLENSPKYRFYSGHGTYDKKPIREPPTHKWYISKEEYPYTYFPSYCNGNGYVMSMDLVHRIASCFPQDLSCSFVSEQMVNVTDATTRRLAFQRCRQSLTNNCGMYIKFEDVTIGSILSNYNEEQAAYNETMLQMEKKYGYRSYIKEDVSSTWLRCQHEPRIINEPEAVRRWGGLISRSRCREDFIMIHRVKPALMWRYFYSGTEAKICDGTEFYPDPVSHLKKRYRE